ncbi:MAG TPA: hypothetical protein VMF69_13675 [Gemmataceae bacterium]|nr:hypothetical protein [Gemmataceae bacterium]
MDIRDSNAYQAILDEGRIESLQRTLLRQGRQKFGSPTDATTAAITAISDRERLESITDQLLIASSWDELLATP